MFSSISSSSPYLLTRLLPTSHHCFVSLPRGTFQSQLATRDHGQGCMVLLVEWTLDPPAASAPTSASANSSTPQTTPTVRRVYVGWMGEYLTDEGASSASGTMGSIGVPAQFATLLGIPAGIRVQVSCLPDRPPPAGLITLEPMTPDDFEILELNAGAVEMNLLSQVQVLNPGQVIPFWLASGIRIKLKNATLANSGGASPAPYHKLTLHSEISIIPKPRPSKSRPQESPIPQGPPPNIVKLRVQPREEGKIMKELTEQRRLVKEASERKKDALREARWREWEEKNSESSLSSMAFDMNRALAPAPSTTPLLQPPSTTLDQPHYIHVSAATMKALGCKQDDLAVISFVRKVAPTQSPLVLAPSASNATGTQETLTTVVRVAEWSHVVRSDSSVPAESSTDIAAHVLLSRALMVFLRAHDFDWVHVQRLTPHSSQIWPHNPVRQSLCVRESAQRLQNIRLREIEVQIKRSDPSSATGGGSSLIAPLAPQPLQSIPGASARASMAAEADARAVGQAFISFVRAASRTGGEELASDAPTVPLAVPLVNGGVIELDVPIATTERRIDPSTKKRFFQVHFNEPDLLAAAQAAKAARLVPKVTNGVSQLPAPEPEPSLLDRSILPEVPSAPQSAPGMDQSSLKVAMATPFFLVQAPPPTVTAASASSSISGKKKSSKNRSSIPPLPVPVLHIAKVKVEMDIGMFEQGLSGDGVDRPDDSLSAPSSLHLPFSSLGGSNEWHKSVVAPLWRFFKATLCRKHILERAAAVHSGENGQANDALPPAASPGGLLLTGSKGVGKTTLLWAMCAMLRTLSNPAGVLAATEWIDCKQLLGRKISEVKTSVGSALKRAQSSLPAPTVIVLEDIDKLLPLAEENGGGASLRSTQLSDMLVDQVSEFFSRNPSAPVAFIAIAESANSHHPALTTILPHLLQIPNPSAADRVAIVQAIVTNSHAQLSGKIDVTSIGRKTEGYTASDLKQLVLRMVHASISRGMHHPPARAAVPNDALVLSSLRRDASENSAPAAPTLTIDSSDVESAFRDFVPGSLKDLVLAGGGGSGSTEEDDLGWESIGGMFDVKRTLLDTFELPVKYAELFALAPLKLRSGLLLYGPSGCGKTMLASRIAKRCGLNFISVKGPELLNKYIGSSEQNVRDTFQKARNAAPALLFFDEMDSIVPARGGDSTGVTDRVVNQFLCELDGVEGKISGGKQLYVLGASSRPDMIDPALLRPGRLDKSIYCGPPDRNERKDMLRCMVRRLKTDEELDLDYIADQTEHYTPADLQAIVTNAQMSLVQEVIANAQRELTQSKVSNAQATSSSNAPLVLPPLTQAHLMRSLAESKPSTSAEKRETNDQYYGQFRRNREGRREKNELDAIKKQRQALA